MKKNILNTIIVLCAIMLPTLANAQSYIINKTNGEKIVLPYNEVDSIVFSNENENDKQEYEYVDLGLSVLWATCNVGATTPEGYGDFFAWGEIAAKENYSAEGSLTYGKRLEDISGNAEYDAATAIWGSPARIPTFDEMEELINNCSTEWGEINGVKGLIVKSNINQNTIFLPAAGYAFNDIIIGEGERGGLWTSTPDNEGYDEGAYRLTFSGDEFAWDWSHRGRGRNIRPVCNK